MMPVIYFCVILKMYLKVCQYYVKYFNDMRIYLTLFY